MKKLLNKHKANFDDMEVLPIFPNQSQKLLRKEMTSTLYEYYLVGEIGDASEYIELCDVLRSANENDQVVIRINSCGGLLSTANMVINAIYECQAHVHGFIESECASAAIFILLACHSYSLGEEAEMMIHTSSSGYVGKESEQHNYVAHSRKKIHRMMRNRYEGFLTENELSRVLDGVDLYFDRDDVAERLERYSEVQREKFMQEMEALEKEIPDEEKSEPMFKKQLLS